MDSLFYQHWKNAGQGPLFSDNLHDMPKLYEYPGCNQSLGQRSVMVEVYDNTPLLDC